MKKIFSLLLATSMAFGLAACSPSGTAPVTTTGNDEPEGVSTDAEPGGRAMADQIVVALSAAPTNLDAVTLTGNEAIWMTDLLYGTLVRATADGSDNEAYMAESWSVSDDGLTYTFKLREGMTFSDGTPVTGEDWVWSILRARDTEESLWTSSAESIQDVKAEDDTTLVITLAEPRSSFIAEMGMFNLGVQCKSYFEKTGESAYATVPMGTGPYKIKEWVDGEYILFEKNEHYYDADSVLTPEIKFVFVEDDNSRIMMLQAGEVDVIKDIPYSSMASVAAMDGVKAEGINSTETRFLLMNNTSEILSNQKVREALRMGTDLQELVDMLLYGYGETAVSFMSPAGMYWNDKITPVTYNAEEAKQMLSDAGYDDLTLTLTYTQGNATYEQITTILEAQWQKIGVTLKLEPLEKTTYVECRNALDFDLMLAGWSDDITDPSMIASYFWDYDIGLGFYTGFQNEEGTQIYRDAITQLDTELCRQDYYKLQQIYYDACPAIVLYYSQMTLGMSDDVENFVVTSLGKFRLDHVVKYVD